MVTKADSEPDRERGMQNGFGYQHQFQDEDEEEEEDNQSDIYNNFKQHQALNSYNQPLSTNSKALKATNYKNEE